MKLGRQRGQNELRVSLNARPESQYLAPSTISNREGMLGRAKCVRLWTIETLRREREKQKEPERERAGAGDSIIQKEAAPAYILDLGTL